MWQLGLEGCILLINSVMSRPVWTRKLTATAPIHGFMSENLTVIDRRHYVGTVISTMLFSLELELRNALM